MRHIFISWLLIGTGLSAGCGSKSQEEAEPVSFAELSVSEHQQYANLQVVSWEQSKASKVSIEYSVDEGEWRQTPATLFTEGAHEQILLGLPFDWDVQWRLVSEGQILEGPLAHTGKIPGGVPVPVLLESSPEEHYEAEFLLTSINQQVGGWTGGTYWTILLDRQARIVWARRTKKELWTLYPSVSKSGDHLLIDQASAWSNYDDGEKSELHHVYLDGDDWSEPTRGMHHGFFEHEDGTLSWGSLAHASHESLVERAIGAKTETVIWNCEDDWFLSSGNYYGGYCESNSLFFSESRQKYLYSFYTHNTAIEVDRATGATLWWAGQEEGSYSFAEPDMAFEWQHGINWTEAGTLLVSTYGFESPGAEKTNSVREYTVDEDSGVLTMIWKFESGIYADTNGDARRLSNGNTLHMIGSSGHLFEVNAQSEPVWHVSFEANKLLGRGEFITDLYALLAPEEEK